VRTALTVAIGLAQIGEFSFIVGQTALSHNMMPEAGMQVLVAAAMVSITLNPFLFASLDRIEAWLRRVPRLWNLLNGRHAKRAAALNAAGAARVSAESASAEPRPLAIIAGYGPVGRVVDAMLRDAKIDTVIVDMNIGTVSSLAESGRAALYGDATHHELLLEAGIVRASYLVVTVPSVDGLASLVLHAKELNPTVQVIVRTRYLAEGDALRQAGASHVVFEEGETGIALARHVLERRGVEKPVMERVLGAIRTTWRMDSAAKE
jgi:CPA2 family monovalent cation:H+ antiporter-2